MKHALVLVSLFISITYFGCNRQFKQIKLADVKFESIFGYPKDSSCIYCLLGSGFFRAPSSKNTDSLITDWMRKHRNAILLPISALNDKPKVVYCWMIDGNDTLNTVLIRNGCYPGGTMMGATNNTSMSEVYISTQTYDSFIDKIKTAETFARNNKLGIWIKNDPFE